MRHLIHDFLYAQSRTYSFSVYLSDKTNPSEYIPICLEPKNVVWYEKHVCIREHDHPNYEAHVFQIDGIKIPRYFDLLYKPKDISTIRSTQVQLHKSSGIQMCGHVVSKHLVYSLWLRPASSGTQIVFVLDHDGPELSPLTVHGLRQFRKLISNFETYLTHLKEIF
jgi:hypothetical protein